MADGSMEVVIVGGIVTDRVSYYSEIPPPGETAVPNRVEIHRGGKGANMSVMASKLGTRIAFFSKIGDDDFGKMHLNGLREQGVSTDYITVAPDVSTDMVDIAVAADGRNRIDEVSRTCMYQIKPSDIEHAEGTIGQAGVIGCSLEPHVETSLAALRLGRKRGLTTLFNAAPLLDCSAITDDIYRLSDVFFCNQFEASSITGLPCKSVDDAKLMSRNLLKRGCTVVIITMGHEGCVYASSHNQNTEHLPARQVKAVDTTGASDAFFGALCFYIARFGHLDMRERIRRSMEIATITVIKEGTQDSYPDADDLDEGLLR